MTPDDGVRWRTELELLRDELRAAIAGLGDDPDANAAVLEHVNLASCGVHAIRLRLDAEKRALLAPRPRLHAVGSEEPVPCDPLVLRDLYALVEDIAWNDCERALLCALRGLHRMNQERQAYRGHA